MRKSPQYFAETLSNDYDCKITARQVDKAWRKLGLVQLDESNSPKLTEKGIARGGQYTQSGYAFSFDYDELKEEVYQQIKK